MVTWTSSPASPSARNFVLRAIAWSVALFGALRLRGLENAAVLPFTQLQGRLAAGLFGPPQWPIDVTLACSGADVIALCTGFILAYPARWRSRIIGVLGGLALLVALNIVRIGTLGLATSRAWFDLLHTNLWPAVLVVAAGGYVFAWMTRTPAAAAADPIVTALAEAPAERPLWMSRRFVVTAGAGLVLFTALAPLYLQSTAVMAVAAFVTSAAAGVLRFIGVDATATGNVLSTARGGFLVTQECITTPLIPLYIAGVLTAAITPAHRTAFLLATVPIFVALGVARLLVVALPATLVESPVILVHAFYQLVAAGAIVWLAAAWRHGEAGVACRRAAAGAVVGAVCFLLLQRSYGTLLAAAFPGAVPPGDPQGAMAILPGFQVALYAALSVGVFAAVRWRLVLVGVIALGLSQVIAFAVLDLFQRQAGLVPHIRDLRALALGAPLLLIVAMVFYDRPQR